MEGIEMDSLPKTIRDAILMTRKLEIRYLWVDALCIIQPTNGDSTDWNTESLCMGSYYQRSIVTFAAAVGANSSDGLWREEPLGRSGEQVLTSSKTIFKVKSGGKGTSLRITSSDPNWRKMVQRSALRYRGWALQELVLSPRVLYWTPDGVYWDCCCSVASEYKRDTLSFNEFDQLDPLREMRLQFSLAKVPRNAARVRDRWYGIVAQFSRMELTYATDTLPAISGIAKAVKTLTSGAPRYAAGVWIDSWYDLAWRVAYVETSMTSSSSLKRKGMTAYVAPSWSWASATASVTYPDMGRQQGVLYRGKADPAFEILDVRLWLWGDDPMGQLQDGALHLRGPMTTFWVVLEADPADPCHWFEEKVVNTSFSGTGSSSSGRLHRRTNFYFDKETSKEDCPNEIACLVIGTLGGSCYGILLEGVPGYIGRYRRVGIAQRHETNPFDFMEVTAIELV
jgi:hypothetical protein